MNDPEGRFKMRFIGKKDGKLMSGAPGNYEQGRVYLQPFRHSRYKWWELIEPLPELVVPPMDDTASVYEEVFLPPEESSTYDPEAEVTTVTIKSEGITGILGGDGAVIESMKEYEKSLTRVDELEVLQEEPEEEPAGYEYPREVLMAKLDAVGIEYSKRAHNKTLQAMVAKLESEEGS